MVTDLHAKHYFADPVTSAENPETEEMYRVYTFLNPLDFEDSGVPYHTESAIINYYYKRHHPGGFVSRMLAKDYDAALSSADAANSIRFDSIKMWMETNMPAMAYGSAEIVTNWIWDRTFDNAK